VKKFLRVRAGGGGQTALIGLRRGCPEPVNAGIVLGGAEGAAPGLESALHVA